MEFHGGDSFIEAGKNETATSINYAKLKNASIMIYNILLIIGMAVAVVIGTVLGVKFLIGSMEEKAQIKEALIPFVIGCVVVFGAFGIWKAVISVGSKL